FEEEYGDPSKIDDLEQLYRLKRSPFCPKQSIICIIACIAKNWTHTRVETDTLEKNKDMSQFNLSHINEKDQHDAMYVLDKAKAKDIEKAGAIGIDEDDDDMNLTRSMSDYIPQQQMQHGRLDKENQIKEEDEIGGDGHIDDDLDLSRSHSEAPKKKCAKIQKQREEKKKFVLEFKPKALERR
ncbi:hypothetical protein RFI_40330, partial [Reticulomyxa filosa]